MRGNEEMRSIEPTKVSTASMTSGKWFWMMDWCKKRGMPPADNAIWKMAEEAYNEMLKGQA